MAESPDRMSPDELARAIREMKVSDLLLATLSTIAQLGFAKLDPQTRDLDQARLAIESMRALLGILEPFADTETYRDYAQTLANLQVAYAQAVGGDA